MNLIPMGFRLGSIPELAPYPARERRRLWRQACTAAARPAWPMYVVFAALGVISGLSPDYLRGAVGRIPIFAGWSTIIRSVSGGRINISASFIGQTVSSLLYFAVIFWTIELVLRKRVLKRLREILAGDVPEKAAGSYWFW